MLVLHFYCNTMGLKTHTGTLSFNNNFFDITEYKDNRLDLDTFFKRVLEKHSIFYFEKR